MEPRIVTYGILPQGSEPRVLLVPEPNGWTLPRVTSAEPFRSRASLLNQAFREQLGVEVTVLHRVAGGAHCEAYSLENHSPERTPPTGRWIGGEELPALSLAVPEHRLLLEAWFAETVTGETPLLRNAWERPGWLAEASDWMRRELDRLGIAVTGPVRQDRSWSISCLLRVATSQGGVFMKAAPPMFAHEPALSQALAERYPGQVPDVLAIDAERRWLLMREFGGQQLRAVTAIAPWEQAARLLARIQVDTTRQTDWLRSLGCPDRQLEQLAAQVDPLFADTAALTPERNGLSPEEIDRLRAMVPRLKALCAELAAGPVPPSLVHGDLHPGNITVEGDAVRIYDWTDGCVAHPFLDLVTLIPEEPQLSVPSARDRLRTAYLEAWTGFAPMDDLIRLFEQARLLGSLHQAVSYRSITAGIEAKAEMEGGVPGFLRQLLT